MQDGLSSAGCLSYQWKGLKRLDSILNGLKDKVRKNGHISWISWEGFTLDEEGIDVSKLLKEDINLITIML